jgi:hypothetical protein
MPDVYAFERCPLRDMAHAVADRSALVRHTAGALWPAARRAERVELSDDGIAVWSLTGQKYVAWEDIAAVRLGRTLQIRGAAGRIDVPPHLPGFDQIERRVMARGAALAA